MRAELLGGNARASSTSAEAERDPSSQAYAAAALRSNLLGVLTIGIFTLIVVLMVTKPF